MIRRMRRSGWTASAACAALLMLVGPALADRPGFASPSGNIMCYLEDDPFVSLPLTQRDIVCLIFEANWTLPDYYGDDDLTCDLDRTRTIVLPVDGPARARWTCHGDVFWPFHGAIGYGADWSMVGFACQMAETGVTCQNGRGNGFSVRRAGATLY